MIENNILQQRLFFPLLTFFPQFAHSRERQGSLPKKQGTKKNIQNFILVSINGQLHENALNQYCFFLYFVKYS